MKGLAVKTFLKKVWAWTKAHFWLPIMLLLLLVGFLLYILTRNAAFLTTVIEAFDGSRESYKKEIEYLNESRKKEAEEKSKALEEYNKNLKVLEEEYAARNETLGSDKKKELKKLIDESYNDPDKLARELATLYGLENG
jgi:hypothetical protein